ncbi:MAG: hypothetical protein AVDCRST_MAG67-4482, partial [uncultured Solirubrobacteraceae bacterium]
GPACGRGAGVPAAAAPTGARARRAALRGYPGRSRTPTRPM